MQKLHAAPRFEPARAHLDPRVTGQRAMALLQRMVELVLTWQDRATQRSKLAQLDDRMLRDIGLNQSDAAIESSKAFWRP